MRLNVVARSVLVAFVVGCGKEIVSPVRVTTPDVVAAHSGVKSLGENGYPTAAELQAAGYSLSGSINEYHAPIGQWTGGYTSWKGTASFTFPWMNDVDASLTATVIRNDNGSTLNSASDVYGRHDYVPIGDQDPVHTLTATASTLNHTCGITGKVHADARAQLLGRVFINTTYTVVPIFTAPTYSKDGAQLSLDDCATQQDSTSQQVENGCPTQVVYDPSTCGSNGGGGPSSGGSVEPSGYCELWVVTTYESKDNWATEYVVSRTYFWVC